LNVSYNKLSDSDVLGEALLEMRKSLEHAKDLDEKRKIKKKTKPCLSNEGDCNFC
jgi:hypothetical protein